jgi:hypothetical protein
MRERDTVIVLLPWPVPGPTSSKEFESFYRLIKDMHREEIRIVPMPPFPFHPGKMPFPPDEMDWWEWEYWLERMDRHFFYDIEYWFHKWEKYSHEGKYYWRHWKRYLPEMIHHLNRLADRELIKGILIVTLPGVEDQVDLDEMEQIIDVIADDMPIFHISLGQTDREMRLRFPIVWSFNYPDDRSRILENLTSLRRGAPDRYPAKHEKAPPKVAKETPSEVAHDEVYLGAAAPYAVCPSEEFVVRFAAYTETHRNEVLRVIEQEAPSAHQRLDLESCLWRPGAKVNVRLNAHYVEVTNPVQTFIWNGAWRVLRFDIKVPFDVKMNTIILKFDVAVEGLPIIAIRPEIEISRKGYKKTNGVSTTESTAPRSAFASYAKEDRRDVLGRVRSLQIFTKIDVFLDCLSIRPGEKWKSKLRDEIHDRDIFWLFWSRSAIASKWVEWEWQTALVEKSLAGIQPHPLEPADLAPPPKELSELQFGAMYEWYIFQLRKKLPTISFLRSISFLRVLWGKVMSLIRQKRENAKRIMKKYLR